MERVDHRLSVCNTLSSMRAARGQAERRETRGAENLSTSDPPLVHFERQVDTHPFNRASERDEIGHLVIT